VDFPLETARQFAVLIAQQLPLEISTPRFMETFTMSTTGSAEDAMRNLAKTAVDARMHLDEIFVNLESNIREEYDEDELANLQANIEAVGGILTSLHVVEVEPTEATEGKRYALVSGFRRAIALAELGETDPTFLNDVPCRVIEPQTHGGLKLAQLIENIQRANLKPLEKAMGFKQAMSDEVAGLSQRDVARLLGISDTAVSQHLRLLDLPDLIKDMLDDGEISFSHARAIMYQVPQDQWPAAAKLAATMTIGDFVRRVESRYGEPSDGEGGEEGAPEENVQRAASMIRAQKLKKVYLPYFHQQFKDAKTEVEKGEWSLRLDTIKWMMQDSTTVLARLVKPYDEQLAAEEEAQSASKKVDQAMKKYMRDKMTELRKLRKIVPADGETKTTLVEDLAMIRVSVTALITKPDYEKTAGFTLESVDTFMEDMAKAWADDLKKKEEERQKRAKKKAEKEAADAKAAAEKKDETSASPGGDAAAG